MDECEKCGIEISKEKLYDAIGKEGIIKLCEKCLKEEDFPIVRKPTTYQLKKEEEKHRGESFKESVERFKKQQQEKTRQNKTQEQDTQLRSLVEQNTNREIQDKKTTDTNLVENFHWKIMRERRLKKISQDKLAKEIGESVTAIKMAEKGTLPQDSSKLISKLESYLRVRLKKQPEQKQPEEIKEDMFDPVLNKEINVSDVKELEEKEKKGFFSKFKRKKKQKEDKENSEDDSYEKGTDLNNFEEETEDYSNKNSKEKKKDKGSSNEEDIPQEEIDRILYGKDK